MVTLLKLHMTAFLRILKIFQYLPSILLTSLILFSGVVIIKCTVITLCCQEAESPHIILRSSSLLLFCDLVLHLYYFYVDLFYICVTIL